MMRIGLIRRRRRPAYRDNKTESSTSMVGPRAMSRRGGSDAWTVLHQPNLAAWQPTAAAHRKFRDWRGGGIGIARHWYGLVGPAIITVGRGAQRWQLSWLMHYHVTLPRPRLRPTAHSNSILVVSLSLLLKWSRLVTEPHWRVLRVRTRFSSRTRVLAPSVFNYLI